MKQSLELERLTAEERAKLGRIVAMINEKKELEPEVFTLEEQIDFIKRHGEGKMRFYSGNFFTSNPQRTKAIYFQVRAAYVKEYNYKKPMYTRAAKSMLKLLSKATTPTEVNV